MTTIMRDYIGQRYRYTIDELNLDDSSQRRVATYCLEEFLAQ
jgi:hypothetical protein